MHGDDVHEDAVHVVGVDAEHVDELSALLIRMDDDKFFEMDYDACLMEMVNRHLL